MNFKEKKTPPAMESGGQKDHLSGEREKKASFLARGSLAFGRRLAAAAKQTLCFLIII
jgi:hypothetical protein